MKRKATITAALIALGSMNAVNASIVAWLNQAQTTTGNVTADSTGWTFDGTAGVAYDFGALDALDGKPVNGATVEFIPEPAANMLLGLGGLGLLLRRRR